jgi:hypothetical protein
VATTEEPITEERSALLARLGLDGQNKASMGRVLATGSIAEATERADDTMEATIRLDGPGYYWYSSPGGNDEGRGLTAAIVVRGEVPPEARSVTSLPTTGSSRKRLRQQTTRCGRRRAR